MDDIELSVRISHKEEKRRSYTMAFKKDVVNFAQEI